MLGVLGLGIPAIIAGAVALKQGRPGRFKAMFGILLGSVGTLVLAVFLIGLAARGCSSLDRHLTPANVPRFVEAVTPRIDAVQERADGLRERLGPGAADDVADIYALLNAIRQELDEIQVSLDEEELNTLRVDLLDKLERAEALLPR